MRPATWSDIPKAHVFGAAVVPDSKGVVRAEGKKLYDDNGPFLALGATLFPMPWACLHDAERLRDNIRDMLEHGCEFFRVGSVTGSGGANVHEDSWYDRCHNPGVQGWSVWIDGNRRMCELAVSMGFRVMCSIFLSADRMSREDRRRVVQEMATLFNQFPDRVLYAEISNEAKLDTAESHELVALLRSLCPWLLVTSTAADWGGASNVVAQHPERKTTGEGGMWEHCEQMYECFKDKPHVGCIQEPIGPHSSVAEDDDPARLACDAVTGFVCGAPIYVYHCGAGIRFGGEADRNRNPSRHANFRDYPTLPKTWELLRQAKQDFQDDVANFGHVTHSHSKNDYTNGGAFPFKTAPLQDLCCGETQGFLKFYCCAEGVQSGRFAASVMCVSKGIPLSAPSRRMVFTVREIGGSAQKVELEKDQTFTFVPSPDGLRGFYVVGEFA